MHSGYLATRNALLLDAGEMGAGMAHDHEEHNELTQLEAQKRYRQVSSVDYEIALKLDAESETYQGLAVIHFNYSPTEEQWLSIDFITLSLLEIELNGQKCLSYQKRPFFVEIPTKELIPGRNEIRFQYENSFDHGGSGFHRFVDPEDGSVYLHTDFEPFDAHRLFPCFDQPDIKAHYALSVEGPDSWVYLHNTAVMLQIQHDQNRYLIQFEPTPLFSTYLFSLVAGPYSSWHSTYRDIPLGVHCRKSLAQYVQSQDAENIFEITSESFAFLEEYFDYPYPYKKYDQVFVPEFNFGAMENVACVTFSERMIFRHEVTYNEKLNRANTITHEMVHMWFGDLVTMKWWDDLWLNESFADYLSYYTMSKGKLFPDALEHFYTRKEWAYWQDQLSTTHPIAAKAANTTEAFSNFDGISYAKGAAVLRQLQYRLGEERFRDAVRLYFKRFQNSNTTFSDFLGVFSEVSGEELRPWSEQWLTTTGVNRIDYEWQEQNLIVRQDQDVTREHRFAYMGFKRNQEAFQKIFEGDLLLTEREAFLSLPEADFLICNAYDYDYVKIRLRRQELEMLSQILSSLEESFHRRMVWGTMWQMVLDAELSPMIFMQTAAEQADLESNISILNSQIVTKMQQTMRHYLNSGKRSFWMSQLFLAAMTQLRDYDHTKEQQILWFRLLLTCADGDDDFDILDDVLSSRLKFPQLEMDQEKRWDIITRMVAFGYQRGIEYLGEEQKRDTSDLGQKRYMQAFISQPDETVKRKFWERVLAADASESTDFLRRAMEGFHWLHQDSLLVGYQEKFLDGLEGMYQKNNLHLFSAYSHLLFPFWEGSELFLQRIKSRLEDSALPPLVRKELLEHRDNLQRKIKVLTNQ